MAKWILAIFAFALFSSAGAIAQTTQPDPLPAEEMLNQMLKPQPGATSQPTSRPQVQFVAAHGHGVLAGTTVIREGTDIYNRPGRLKKNEDGGGVDFVFDDDGSPNPLPDMAALPDLKLMSMENAQATTSRTLHFVVSGTVTEYKGHNYLLMETSPDDAERRNVIAPARPTGDKPRSADQLLSDMLSSPAGGNATAPEKPAPPAGPMTDSTSGAGAVAPGAPVLTVMREGSQIVDRLGRLTKSADGQQSELTFDADGSAMEDPPLIILPNLKLTTMENSVQNGSADKLFRVTGMVTEYRGRNYILLQKLVVVPEPTRQL